MITSCLVIVLTILLPLISMVHTTKVLFFCLPIYSHVQQMSYIADAVITNGHEAWITAFSDLEEPLNLKQRKIHTIPFKKAAEMEEMSYHMSRDPDSSLIYKYLRTGKRELPLEKMKKFLHTFVTDEGLADAIVREKFDLMVIDSHPTTITLTVLAYKYNVPFVLFGPYCGHFAWRIPFSPSFVPFKLLPYTDRMSFTERLINTMTNVAVGLFDPFNVKNAVAEYVPERPFIDTNDLQRKALLYLVEVNPLLDFPYPTMPNVVKIGSLAPRTEAKLPQSYSNFLDRSANGVVMVSFGSIFPNDNLPILEKLATAFISTKYDFIIRGGFMKNSSRVIISNWIPQKALLKHEKVKLFITHCGTNGVGEAISNAKPMLCFPIFADQPANGALIARRGYGLELDLFASRTDEIISSINEIIENPSYKSSVQRASSINFDLQKQEKPSEVAAFWIDHVIRFGGDHLRSSSSDMPLYQYLLLDVLAFISVIVAIVVFLLLYCVKICYHKLCARKPKEKLS